MKKTVLFVSFLLRFLFFCNAENDASCLCVGNYKDIDNFRCISFLSSEKIKFSDENDLNSSKIWNQIFNYKILTDGKLSYIVISKKDFSEKLLMLYSNEFLVLYDKDNNLIFKGSSKIKSENIYFPDSITASSELKEGNIIYSSTNLLNLELDKCWVENKSDYGIGEYIKFEINGRGFFIFNGYLSGKKSYLYNQNSRIKEIEVTLLNNNISKIYSVYDNPNPQLILFDNDYSGEIIVKIKNVYKGTKYSDTCLNSILLVH